MDWTYFLACIISVSSFAEGQTPKYVHKGTWYNLKPDIPGQPSSILWKHDGNKVVEFDGRVQQVIGSYKNRITLDKITAELKITDLRSEDSGNYKVEVKINNYLHTKEYQLEVIEEESSFATIVALSILVGVGTVLGMLFCKWKQKAPPMLDPQSKLFGHAKNYEGAEDDVPNKSLQEKAPSEETPATTTDETSYLTETPRDTPANTENVHNKETEVTEKTEENTTGQDLLSEQRLSSVPEQEDLDKTPLKKDSVPLKDEENTEETNEQNQGKPGYVGTQRKMFVQPETQKEANKAPASPPPMLDPQSKPFDQTKNDEGGEDDVPCKSLQKKAPSEEPPVLTKDESPLLTEAPPDKPVHTENEDNKKHEITEQTAGTTTGLDSLRQRISSVPEQEDLDKTSQKKKSNPPKDEENIEEPYHQNQVKLGYVKMNVKKFEQFMTQYEANKGPGSYVVHERAPSEETSAPVTVETFHLTEISPDKPANTENVHNKESEVTEETAGTTTGPGLSRYRSSSVPEQEGSDKTTLKNDSNPPMDEENTEETSQQNQRKPGYVKMNVKKFEQFMTQNEANKGPGYVRAQRRKFEKPETEIEANQMPASAPPVLDPQSKPFDQTKNDEGGQDDVPNKSLQEEDPTEETSATTTDETSHLTEASSDKHALTENEDNKEPEITEKTAGTTIGPDLSSQQRSLSVPEQEGTDTSPEKESDSSIDEENAEETNQQNQALQM